MRLQLQIFAKAPIPGRSKTRLIPALGAEGAARLQQRMTGQMVKEAVAADLGEVALYCALDCEHPSFSALQQRYAISRHPQRGGDIGVRMSVAIEAGLQHHDGVILMGSDCPQITRTLLQQVAEALQSHAVVMVPARDGGYVLVAMSHPLPALFEGVEWGSGRVMAQSAAALQRLGVDWMRLPPLVDVDRPEELNSVPQRWLHGE